SRVVSGQVSGHAVTAYKPVEVRPVVLEQVPQPADSAMREVEQLPLYRVEPRAEGIGLLPRKLEARIRIAAERLHERQVTAHALLPAQHAAAQLAEGVEGFAFEQPQHAVQGREVTFEPRGMAFEAVLQ